jgi:hypothetical protein
LTGSLAVRYAAFMKEQWSKGLQWGSVVWLSWVAARSTVAAYHGSSLVPAMVWLAALALVWTKWARGGVAAALLVQTVTGMVRATGYGGEMPLPWVLSFFLPMSLPLLPLLLLAPERPRITLALLAVGRLRDAAAQLAGWRWLAVAAALVLLNRAAWEVLQGYEAEATAAVLLLGFASLVPGPRLATIKA